MHNDFKYINMVTLDLINGGSDSALNLEKNVLIVSYTNIKSSLIMAIYGKNKKTNVVYVPVRCLSLLHHYSAHLICPLEFGLLGILGSTSS